MDFSKKEKLKALFIQFVKFGIVGLSNTAISYAINVAVLLICSPFELSWDYILGNVLSFIISVLWSFWFNNIFVFKESRKSERKELLIALLKTYLAYGFTGIILNNILSYVWIELLSISKYIAPLFNLVISVPVNYILVKLWAFEDKAGVKEEASADDTPDENK